MGDEGIVLTDQERQALADLADQIGDPWLARQLVGQVSHHTELPNQKASGPARSILHRLTSASTPGWVGLLVVLAGAALVVTTFVHSIILGAFGLLVMGAGLWLLIENKREVIARRLTEQRVPAPVPPPPHTPPAEW